MRFGDEKLKNELRGYIEAINERIFLNKYNNAINKMNSAQTIEEFKNAAKEFEKISGYNDADAKAEECRQKELQIAYDLAIGTMSESATSQQYAEASKMFFEIADAYPPAKEKAKECVAKSNELAEAERQDKIYAEAVSKMEKNSITWIKSAIKLFNSIIAWRDSEKKINECKQKIANIEKKKRALKRTKIIICVAQVFLNIIIIVLCFCPISPSYIPNEYNSIMSMFEWITIIICFLVLKIIFVFLKILSLIKTVLFKRMDIQEISMGISIFQAFYLSIICIFAISDCSGFTAVAIILPICAAIQCITEIYLVRSGATLLLKDYSSLGISK